MGIDSVLVGLVIDNNTVEDNVIHMVKRCDALLGGLFVDIEWSWCWGIGIGPIPGEIVLGEIVVVP